MENLSGPDWRSVQTEKAVGKIAGEGSFLLGEGPGTA